MVLDELFNQSRMEKCARVFQTMMKNWATTKRFDCTLATDEPIVGKSLEELGKCYFEVGTGTDVTTLPFLDTLIVFKMLADHGAKKTKWQGNEEKYQVTTKFTEDEAFGLLQTIVYRYGLTVRNPAPTSPDQKAT